MSSRMLFEGTWIHISWPNVINIGRWEVTKSHLVSLTKKNPASRVLSEPAILPAVARAIATNFPLRSRIFTGARLPNLARISWGLPFLYRTDWRLRDASCHWYIVDWKQSCIKLLYWDRTPHTKAYSWFLSNIKFRHDRHCSVDVRSV